MDKALLYEATRLLSIHKQISRTFLQRKLKINSNEAMSILKWMAENELIPKDHPCFLAYAKIQFKEAVRQMKENDANQK